MLWEYSGLVRIEREVGTGDAPMHLPFCFTSSASEPIYTREVIEQMARNSEQAWRRKIRESDPTIDDRYLEVTEVVITSIDEIQE